jgi:hypothetical protein
MNPTQVNLTSTTRLRASDKATGYERLLYDAMIGDKTLYHRADMVEGVAYRDTDFGRGGRSPRGTSRTMARPRGVRPRPTTC